MSVIQISLFKNVYKYICKYYMYTIVYIVCIQMFMYRSIICTISNHIYSTTFDILILYLIVPSCPNGSRDLNYSHFCPKRFNLGINNKHWLSIFSGVESIKFEKDCQVIQIFSIRFFLKWILLNIPEEPWNIFFCNQNIALNLKMIP